MEQNLNQCNDQGCGSGSACIRIQFFSPGSGPGRKKLKITTEKSTKIVNTVTVILLKFKKKQIVYFTF